MPRFERICPECGTSNSYKQANCVKCRAPLTPTNAAQTPPVEIFSRRGIAKLAWRATKFLTRAGFNFARRGAERGIERVRQHKAVDVKNETIEGEYQVKPRATNDWRVWSQEPDTPTDKTERLRWNSKKDSR